MSENNGTNNILAFMLGGVIGAGIALLYAPRSGKESREEISRLMDKVKGQAVMREKKLELKMFRAVDDISNRVIDILSEGREISEARKEELLKAITDARRSLDQDGEPS
jgi:gas vesicle protein